MKAVDHQRITGHMLRAVSAALLSPDTWIEFESDVQVSTRSAELWRETIAEVCSRLEIAGIEFRVRKGRLWVRHAADE